MGFRDSLNQKPLMGWGLAAVLALATSVLVYRGMSRGETKELTQMVTIRCRETGKEWQIPRGAMEKQLYMRDYPVDPNQGLINPDTGKPTGFPIDDWKATIERVNAERKGMAEGAGGGAPKPPAPKAAPGGSH